MARALALIPFVLFVGLGGLAAVAVAGAEDPPAVTVTETVVQTDTVTVDRRLAGHGVWYWHKRAHRNWQEARRLRRTLRTDGTVTESINLACLLYGHCARLWEIARCETGGTLNPWSRNGSSGASGLMQFLPSTWRTTPFARFSVWSPYASALAAGYMQRAGRDGEWVC